MVPKYRIALGHRPMNEDRSQRLQSFVDWTAAHITGDEKSEAQVFLDHLLKAFARRGVLEAGGKLETRVKKGRAGNVSFADYVWKPVVLIEMKKRGTDLSKHLQQAFEYWMHLAPGRPKYTVLCNFDEFWVYDFNEQIEEPMDKLTLAELPLRYGPLNFLFPTDERPQFKVDRIGVTRKTADLLAECFRRLAHRKDVGRETAQRFILQMLIALFSEDIGLLPKYFVKNLLDECTDPPKTFDLLGGLFKAMATPSGTSGGRFKEVPYFNGGIFLHPAPVELDEEMVFLRRAVEENWSAISPDIFGTIFQHSMNKEERHAYGGHYTTQIDIMKIVRPTIVEPWQNLIENASTLDELDRHLERMGRFTVLDPACGSGNFLYIAYRELKRLEARLVERIQEMSPKSRRDSAQRFFGFVTSKQFFGLDINPFAVELAKVTMALAHKLVIDELHVEEKALPLDNLDANIRCVDALITLAPGESPGANHASPTPWPKCDVIIGNPPFLGAKRLKPERGTDYVKAVRATYPDVPGMADYCVYWLRRAHDHLKQCTPEDPVAGRAGLVGTQNIRNNQSRVGGLDYIAKSGVIVEAVDNQPWSGEANVHVSIVNWVKTTRVTRNTPGARHDEMMIPAQKRLWRKAALSLELFPDEHDTPRHKRAAPLRTAAKRKGERKDKSYELAFSECGHINSALSDQSDTSQAAFLSCNAEFCYTGQYPRHEGFMLTDVRAKEILKSHRRNREVLHPFVVGREFLGGVLDNRWVIDFQKRDQLEAKSYAAPFQHLEETVLPYIRAKADVEKRKSKKDTGQDQNWLQTWWQHFRPRAELISKIENLRRYIVCSRVTKRPVFVFFSPLIRPGDALSCFALSDDYSFGILQSNAHWQWFVTKCSKLTERFRYTPESVFDTFPWPQAPTKKQIEAVAAAGREIRRIRDESLPNIKGGLRALYRTLELPGKNPLKDAHAALDAAMLAAYGFKADADLLKQLLDLNLEVAAKIDRNDPVTAPGIPPNYSDPKSLITKDCIAP